SPAGPPESAQWRSRSTWHRSLFISFFRWKKVNPKREPRHCEFEENFIQLSLRESIAFSRRSILPSISPVYPGRISALTTRDTRVPYSPTASVASLMTAKTSSHSPSMWVSIESVRCDSPDRRTISTAAATASWTDASEFSPPLGATENAASMMRLLLRVRRRDHMALRRLPIPAGSALSRNVDDQRI